jgi:hypothetical protein
MTPPPNVLSMPFTVIIHMVQRFHFLDSSPSRDGFSQPLEGARAGGVQGVCIGVLGAIAVDSAQNDDDIVK